MAESDATEQTLATAGDGDTHESAPEHTQAQAKTESTAAEAKPADWVQGITDQEAQKWAAKYKSPEEAAKAGRELERMVGGALQVPDEGAPKEVWEKFRKRVGCPDSPDKYDLDAIVPPKGADEAFKAAEKAFRERAFALGLNAKQAKALYKAETTAYAQGLESWKQAKAKARETAESKLRSDWGAEYDANMALVKKAVQAFAEPDFVAWLNSGPGNDPGALRYFARVGKAMSEDTLEGGRVKVGSGEKPKAGVLSYPNSPQITGANRFRRPSTTATG